MLDVCLENILMKIQKRLLIHLTHILYNQWTERDKHEIARKIDIEEINDVEYIFLIHHNTIFWNEIVRYFIDKNKYYEWLKYNFMILYEFEKLISLWCERWIDFFDLIKEKTEKFNKNTSYKIIVENFKSYSSKRDFSSKFPKWLNQDFSSFFYKVYNYNSKKICPFVSTGTIFKDFFDKEK